MRVGVVVCENGDRAEVGDVVFVAVVVCLCGVVWSGRGVVWYGVVWCGMVWCDVVGCGCQSHTSRQ